MCTILNNKMALHIAPDKHCIGGWPDETPESLQLLRLWPARFGKERLGVYIRGPRQAFYSSSFLLHHCSEVGRISFECVDGDEEMLGEKTQHGTMKYLKDAD